MIGWIKTQNKLPKLRWKQGLCIRIETEVTRALHYAKQNGDYSVTFGINVASALEYNYYIPSIKIAGGRIATIAKNITKLKVTKFNNNTIGKKKLQLFTFIDSPSLGNLPFSVTL